MEAYITEKVHEEFSRRIDAENERQNRRIQLLEDNVRQINDLTVSVSRMAVNMENMLSAIERQGSLIEKQGERMDALEKEPAESYKQTKAIITTSVVSAIAGAVISAIIALI